MTSQCAYSAQHSAWRLVGAREGQLLPWAGPVLGQAVPGRWGLRGDPVLADGREDLGVRGVLSPFVCVSTCAQLCEGFSKML